MAGTLELRLPDMDDLFEAFTPPPQGNHGP
jgi:hypothetical protein